MTIEEFRAFVEKNLTPHTNELTENLKSLQTTEFPDTVDSVFFEIQPDSLHSGVPLEIVLRDDEFDALPFEYDIPWNYDPGDVLVDIPYVVPDNGEYIDTLDYIPCAIGVFADWLADAWRQNVGSTRLKGYVYIHGQNTALDLQTRESIPW